MTEPDETTPKPKVVRLADKDLIDQIADAARAAIATWLREKSSFVFWHPFEQLAQSEYQWLRFLGFGRRDQLDPASVVKVLVRESPFRFKRFEASWTSDGRYHPTLVVKLKPGAEWTMVQDEIWDGQNRPPGGLSEPAAKLLSWARQADHQDRWFDKSAIGRQAELRGTSWTVEFLKGYFEEIKTKVAAEMRIEEREGDIRIKFGQAVTPPPAPIEHGPLNPVMPCDFKKVIFAELQKFQNVLHDWILATDLPADRNPLVIWRFHDRATLLKCFPDWETRNLSISDLAQFFSEVGIDHGILWGYSFKDPEPWCYYCVPKEGTTWETVKAEIRAARSGPSLAERYGISPEAASMLRWFMGLRAKEWENAMTPMVEEHLEKRIGLARDYSKENFGARLTLLAEELTDKTEWRVRVQPWQGGWHGQGHRLVVRRKETDMERVVREVQVLGLRSGKFLPQDRVQQSLLSLLDPGLS